MDTEPVVKLQVLVGDRLLDIADAAKLFPNQVSKAVESACHTVNNIRLHNIFLESLRSSRKATPYRLNSAVASCLQQKLPDEILEMRFYRRGGVRAVTALATALQDDKSTLKQLHSLSSEQLDALVAHVKEMNAHSDFQNMCLLAEGKASKPVSPTYLAGSRPYKQPKCATTQKNIHPPPSRKRRRTHDSPLLEDPALSADTGTNVMPHLLAQDMEVPNAVWDSDNVFIDLDALGLDEMCAENYGLGALNLS